MARRTVPVNASRRIFGLFHRFGTSNRAPEPPRPRCALGLLVIKIFRTRILSPLGGTVVAYVANIGRLVPTWDSHSLAAACASGSATGHYVTHSHQPDATVFSPTSQCPQELLAGNLAPSKLKSCKVPSYLVLRSFTYLLRLGILSYERGRGMTSGVFRSSGSR